MNKILTKDEQIYEIARDFCRLTCSCEDCSLAGSRNRDKCKAKVYARRAYEKGYKKRDSVPINFTVTEEQIEKMTEDIKTHFEVDINAVRTEVAWEIFGDLLELIAEDTDVYEKCASRLVSSDYSNGRSEAIGTFIGFINELKKKYTEGEG